MYNNNQLNAAKLNEDQQLFDLSIFQDDLVFNGYSLQSSTIITSRLREKNSTKRDLKRVNIPRANGQIITSDFERFKIITINGSIIESSATALEQEVDDMKKNLQIQEGILDITKKDDSIRRYTATLINGDKMFAEEKNFHITFIPFELQFLCINPFGQSTTSEVDEILDETQLSLTRQIENEGTTEAFLEFIMVIASATGITEISIENTTTNEKITITQSFVDNDVLQINSDLKTVQVNGVSVDFLGSFPILDTDTNRIEINLTGTSATYSLTTKYKKTYL